MPPYQYGIADNVVVYEERLSAGKAQQQFISDYYLANPTAPGRSLPPTVQQQRLQVVKTFLGSGIPLLRAVFFRDFFRQLGLSLTSQGHFADIVPQVLAEENCVKNVVVSTTDTCPTHDIARRMKGSRPSHFTL